MKKKRVLFVASYIALALLFVFDLVMLFCILGMKEEARFTGGVVFDPSAQDERPTETPTTMPGVTVAGFSSLTIPPDVDAIAIDLYNPAENNGYYYMTFELRLLNESEQGYEVLFKTGYVAPGKHIYQVALSHSLPAGEYDAQLLIQPYRMRDLSPTNNVSAAVRLKVK